MNIINMHEFIRKEKVSFRSSLRFLCTKTSKV